MRFVRPTRRGWMLLLAALAWFLIALINHVLFPFLFACFLLALVVAGWIGALFSCRRIGVRRGPVGDAATGKPVSMPLFVENRSRRQRQPLVIEEVCRFFSDEPHRVVVEPLMGRETRLVSRRMLATRRGEHTLQTIVIRSGDPAGLFARQRRFHLPKTLLVLPGTESVSELHLHPRRTATAVAGSPISAAGNSQEFYGVREYDPSDGLRHVHWKSSARYGKLMVREFERNAIMSVAVLLDAHEDFVSGTEYASNLEYQIRAAASICAHVSGLYCQFALGCGGKAPQIMSPRPGADVRSEVLYALALLEPGRVPVADVAYELGARLPAGTVVFCLSLQSSPALAKALNVLVQQGMTVRWYCAQREAFSVTHRAAETREGLLSFPDWSVAAQPVLPSMRLERLLAYQG